MDQIFDPPAFQIYSFSFRDILLNLKWASRGYLHGYLSTLSGYFIFALLALNFMVYGNLMTGFIFGKDRSLKVSRLTALQIKKTSMTFWPWLPGSNQRIAVCPERFKKET